MKLALIFCLIILCGCAKTYMDYRPDKRRDIDESKASLIDHVLNKNQSKRPKYVVVTDKVLGLGNGKIATEEIVADTSKHFRGQRILFNDLQTFGLYQQGKKYKVALYNMDSVIVRTFVFKEEEDATFFIDALWSCKFKAKDPIEGIDLRGLE